MAQLTISDGIHAGLSRFKQGLAGLGVPGAEGDLDAFAETLLIAALDALQKELLAGVGKETLLNRFFEIATKRKTK
jgi:hypothetical protein